jgi:hypothetical protein
VALTPSEIGARAEREVAYALQSCGWDVYLPHLAPHTRIDLIAVRPGELVRVQCKTSRIQRGVVVFHTCSNTGNVRLDYRDQIDAFGVFAPDLGRTFLVPVHEAPTRLCSLRLGPTANGQVKGTRLAAEYELRPPR